MKNLLVLLLFVMLSVVLITFISAKNNFDIKSNNNMQNSKNISIFVFDGTDYVAQDTVPVGEVYSLNDEKTYCENGDIVIDYDAVNGIVKYVLNGSDKCALYFDEIKKLYPLENVVYNASQDMGSISDGIMGIWDTGIPVPSDYDSVIYVDLSSRNYDVYDISAVDDIGENFCEINPSLCYETDNIENVLFHYFDYMSSPNCWSTESFKIENNVFKIEYKLNTAYEGKVYGDTDSWVWAFKLQKEGYDDSAWYLGDVYLYGTCLSEDTIIYVYDKKKRKFKKKKIKYIDYDDELLCWDFDNGCYAVAKPLWIKKKQTIDKYNLLKFSDESKLKTIDQHRIYNKEKGMFTYPITDDTPIGTTTFNSKGEYVTLVSKEIIKKKVNYYNVISNYHMNIFTNDILTSCRLNNIYQIQDMKFVKDNRKLIPREEYSDIKDKWYDGLRLAEQPLDIDRNGATKYQDIRGYIKHLEELERK